MNKQKLFEKEVKREISNTELLDEITYMLENSSVEELDVDAIEAKLAVLQERAPIDEEYDQEAEWKRFLDHQLFNAHNAEVSEAPARPTEVKPKKKLGRVFRTVVIAAVMVVFAVVAASAAGRKPIQTLVNWTGDLFSITANSGGELESETPLEGGYHSLREALDDNHAADALCVTWIPERFGISSIENASTAQAIKYIAIYSSSDSESEIIISVSSISSSLENISEREEALSPEKYEINGDIAYFFPNENSLNAVLTHDEYCYSVWGNVTEEEMLSIIESFYR